MTPIIYPKSNPFPHAVSCSICGGLECLCRPRFFAGQLLTESDLQALDHYIIEKNKLHNRYLHGWGAVCGLEVVCHECKGWVTIKSGYALDPCGNDIIVCQDYSFDLCAKIKECCHRKRQDWECDPIASPPPDCQDLEQCWYVTLRYKESESRGITALKSSRAEPGCRTCGCGGQSSKGACHCSCHANGHKNEAAEYATSVRRPPLQCEPTRVCEGFVVELAPAPAAERENAPLEMFEGTLLGRWRECAKAVDDVKKQRPDLSAITPQTPQRLQQACCLYKRAVWDFLSGHPLTHCEWLAKVSELQCPLPTGDNDRDAAGLPVSPNKTGIASILDQLDALLNQFLLECACLAILPPCPPAAADPRVILGCVTVRNDGGACRILDICHWHGRKFVWTWPNVSYWFSMGSLLKRVFENACCHPPMETPQKPVIPVRQPTPAATTVVKGQPIPTPTDIAIQPLQPGLVNRTVDPDPAPPLK